MLLYHYLSAQLSFSLPTTPHRGAESQHRARRTAGTPGLTGEFQYGGTRDYNLSKNNAQS